MLIPFNELNQKKLIQLFSKRWIEVGLKKWVENKTAALTLQSGGIQFLI
jgi:hypothetical protein